MLACPACPGNRVPIRHATRLKVTTMMLRQALAQVRAHNPAATWPAGIELLDPHADDADFYRDPTPRTEFDADPTRNFPWSDDDSE